MKTRALDRNPGELGMCGAMPVDAESILEKAQQRLTTHHAAEPTQVGFASDGVKKHGERLEEMWIAEFFGFCSARRRANDPVGVERRPSGRQDGSHAVEDAHHAGSVGRRCRHRVALRRVARPSIGGKTWRANEREREPIACGDRHGRIVWHW